MSQIFVPQVGGGGGGGDIETIAGNVGGPQSPIGNNFNIITANTTVLFTSTLGNDTLDFNQSNILLGVSGSSITTSSFNTSIGALSLGNLTTGNGNIAIGQNVLSRISTAIGNIGIGIGNLSLMTNGSNNISIGGNDNTGSPYLTNESNNILLGNGGFVGDNNVMRLGLQGSGANEVNQTFVAGIVGNTVSNAEMVTVNSSTGQLGVQTIPAFTPNSQINLFDDFIVNAVATNTLSGSLQWATSGTNWGAFTGTATSAHPGVIGHSSMTSGVRFLNLGSVVAQVASDFVLGGGAMTINWVFNIATASNGTNRYTLVCGIGDTVSSASIANGCWFQYSDNLNSAQWTYNTSSASSATNTNSSTAVTTGWHNAQISINAAASSVTFSIDGVSLGSITTTIPTTGITPFFNIIFGSGTIAAASVEIDLFYLTQTLTTPR